MNDNVIEKKDVIGRGMIPCMWDYHDNEWGGRCMTI